MKGELIIDVKFEMISKWTSSKFWKSYQLIGLSYFRLLVYDIVNYESGTFACLPVHEIQIGYKALN